MSINRVVSALIVSVTVGASLAFILLSSSDAGVSSARTHSALDVNHPHARLKQASTTDMSAPAPREMDFPYYSLRDGFESTMFLINSSLNPAEITVTIHGSRKGTAVSTMKMRAGEKLTIPIRALLETVNEEPDAHGDFAEGNVAVTYVGAMMQVVGQISVVNQRLSLIHESEMWENDPEMSDIPPALNGLWWGLKEGRDAKIMITSTSDERVTADVFLYFGGSPHPIAPLFFQQHETKVLSITELLGDLKSNPSDAPAGGITIIPRPGLRHSLIAEGAVMDELTGFSTTLHFPLPQFQRASSLHAVGVPLGTPAEGPFASAGYFVPHIALRNLTDSPQTVTLTVEFQGDEGPAESALPPLNLSPNATKEISLATNLSALPLPLPFSSIRIQYSGAPGSLVAEVASVEEKGSLVVDNRVANDGNGFAGSGANPWHIDEHTESTFFVTDMGDTPVMIGVRLEAGGKTYHVTGVMLEPHQTLALDLRKLLERAHSKPDVLGTTLPAGISAGTLVWQRLENVPVAGRLLVMDSTAGLASNFDCCQCYCPGIFQGISSVSPSSVTLPQGGTQAFTAIGQFKDWGCTNLIYYCPVPATWSSSNPSVASVSGNTATAQAPGTATLNATYTGCATFSNDAYCNCNSYRTDSGSASLSVFSVRVTNADIVADNIVVALSGDGSVSGQLRLVVTGPNGQAPIQTINTGTSPLIAGTYAYSFQQDTIPIGEFTTVTATWTVNGTNAVSNFSYHFKVLGTWTQTQYNTPAESSCSGGPQQITVWDNQCHGTNTTVISGFDFRVTNPQGGTGSGHSISWGDVSQEFVCSVGSGDLRGFVTIKGTLGPLNNGTVAACDTSPLYVAGTRVYLRGIGIKTVTDRCPACCLDGTHLDNYTTTTSCSGVGNLPDTLTVQLF